MSGTKLIRSWIVLLPALLLSVSAMATEESKTVSLLDDDRGTDNRKEFRNTESGMTVSQSGMSQWQRDNRAYSGSSFLNDDSLIIDSNPINTQRRRYNIDFEVLQELARAVYLYACHLDDNKNPGHKDLIHEKNVTAKLVDNIRDILNQILDFLKKKRTPTQQQLYTWAQTIRRIILVLRFVHAQDRYREAEKHLTCSHSEHVKPIRYKRLDGGRPDGLTIEELERRYNEVMGFAKPMGGAPKTFCSNRGCCVCSVGCGCGFFIGVAVGGTVAYYYFSSPSDSHAEGNKSNSEYRYSNSAELKSESSANVA